MISFNHKGLSMEEAARQLEKNGPNEIPTDEVKSLWIIVFHQFKSPLVFILLVACVLSFALGEITESLAIVAILFLNALIGFLQEQRAENAIQALKNMTAPRACILREGKRLIVAARDLVVGDILILEAGDIVAADGIVLECARLQVNEAILTGESLPIEKTSSGNINGALGERTRMVFMGTSVVTGTAFIQIIATGKNTELGKIARLVQDAEDSPTPLQMQLSDLAQKILFICGISAVFVGLLGIFSGKEWQEIIIFSISLAVAAVPEGLPAIVTVALALGVQRMATQNALVRKLPSVETLGSVSVICTDKTGTLTTGKMQVREIWGKDHNKVLESAASCCEAELGADFDTSTGDPTEIAILQAARERGILKETIERQRPRLNTEPFDSIRKRMSIFRKNGVLYLKGATESIIDIATDSAEHIISVKTAEREMASCGMRVLAIAIGSQPKECMVEIIGLIGISDPPRSEVFDAIKIARGAGITPVMITGDHPATAGAIAKELGLVIEGETLEGRVHARATPAEKLQIVRKWKKNGAIVAMTGDGVNDAPALKEAHVGIAMGKTGTEVTRQSADLILADDNFATIVAAIREGRSIYRNIRKAVLYLLTGNFAELLVVLGALVFALPLPLTATHLLWINLVTDSLPGLALIADPAPEDVMQKKPRPSTEKILRRSDWIELFLVGILEASVILMLYSFLIRNRNFEEARSLAFTTFVFSQMLRALAARSATKVFWRIGALGNLWLLGVITLTGTLQIGLHYLPVGQNIFYLKPISFDDFLIILSVALIPISAIEIKKVLTNFVSKRL